MTTIYIDKEGNLSGLADDTLDKFVALGKKKVERVSNVEFDHNNQQWEATGMDGLIIASHPIRSEVIRLEREYLNKCIEDTFATAVKL